MKRLPFVAAALLITLVACQRFDAETPNPTPSATPVPFATATPTSRPPSTPTVTPTPPPAATPTATQPPSGPTPRPSPTATRPPLGNVIVPSTFETYQDQTFGFQLRYPPRWTAEPTGVLWPLLTVTRPEDEQPIVDTRIFYSLEVLTPSAVLDTILTANADDYYFISDFLGRTDFRTLEESQVTLLDGTPAFQITYQWRSGEGAMRGILLAVVRGSQNFVIQVESTLDDLEATVDDIRALLVSFRLNEPAPLGIPRDQALTLHYDSGPLTLDPAIAQESRSIQYIIQVFSGLVSFDANLVLTAELAQEWEITEGGTLYTFTLRDNARFHDGRPVTAQDVKFSWERAAAPGTGSLTAGTYLNDVMGIGEFMSESTEEISGIEVVDAQTLQVTIDAPKAYFLSKLAHPVTFVVDRDEVEAGPNSLGEPWWAEPNGTGSFRLNTWKPGIIMVLDANEGYYAEPPPIPHVVFRLYGGIQSLMYEAGEIDVGTVFAEELMELSDPSNPLSQELLENPELSIFYVGFAADKPPFDDPLVRRAFLLATDRDKLVRQVFEGSQQIAHGFLPPGLPGHDPTIPPLPFDPGEARRLLEQSSYGGVEGLPIIVYTTSGFTELSQTVIAMLDMWQEHLGVEIGVHLLDPSLYFYFLNIVVDNLYDYGWIADYPDPHNFLDVLFHSEADNNAGNYSNQDVDTLLELARVEQDAAQRMDLYQRAERMLIEDAAAIPLHFGRSHVLVKPYVRDLVFTPFGMIDLRQVSLSDR